MRKNTAYVLSMFGKILTVTFLLIVCFAFPGNPVSAQCDADGFVDECAGNLGEEYSYLRSFEAEEIEGSTNYPYTGAFLFRKGINYVFTMCEGQPDGEKIVVKLYNRTRKLVATSYNEETDKHYNKMIFRCNATAIFFVQTLMPLGEGGCGLTMLGFDAQ